MLNVTHYHINMICGLFKYIYNNILTKMKILKLKYI